MQTTKRDSDGVAFCLIYPFILRFRIILIERLLDILLTVLDNNALVCLIYLNTEEVVDLVVEQWSNHVLNACVYYLTLVDYELIYKAISVQCNHT